MAQGIKMTTDVPESKKSLEMDSNAENINKTEISNSIDDKIKTDGETNQFSEASDVEIATESEQTIGQQLKAKRIEQGLTEQDIATSLKISLDQVKALEADRFDRFLSVAFARGFLKSYCRVVGLEQAPILAAFDSQRDNKEPTIKPVDKVNKQTNLGDPIIIFVSVVIAAVLIFLVFWWPSDTSPSFANNEPTQSQNVETAQAEETTSPIDSVSNALEEDSREAEEENNVAQPSAADSTPTSVASIEEEVVTEPENNVVTGLSPETVAILKEAGVSPDEVVKATQVVPATEAVEEELPTPTYTHDIDIAFAEDCWTEIRDASGRILFSGVKTAGQTLKLSGSAPYRVVLGYARGVSSLKYKGEEFAFSSFIRQDLARFELK